MIPRRVLHPLLLTLAFGAPLSAHATVTYQFDAFASSPTAHLSFTATLDHVPTDTLNLAPSDLSDFRIGSDWGQPTSYSFTLQPNDPLPTGDGFDDNIAFNFVSSHGSGSSYFYFPGGAFARNGVYNTLPGNAGIATLTVVPEPASLAGLALGALTFRRRKRGRRA